MLLTPALLVIAILAGLIAASAVSGGVRAGEARNLVALGGTAGELTAMLQRERVAAALVFAQDSAPAAVQAFRQRASDTDAVSARFRSAVRELQPSAGVQAVLQRLTAQLSSLPALRQQVQAAPDALQSVIVFRYRAVIADLISYRQGLSQVGAETQTANGLRASAALSQAIESLGLLQVGVVRALDVGRVTPATQQDVVAADTGFVEAMQSFHDLATPVWLTTLNAGVGGPAVLTAERLQGVVVRTAPNSVLRLGVDAAGWADAVGARMDLMHGVEADLDRSLLAEVTAQRDAQWRSLALVGSGALSCVLVMTLFGWWVSRSVTRSLTGLREGAEAVAATRLPALVHQLGLGNADPDRVEQLVAEAGNAIQVEGRDEIGQVADSFNRVSATAVRVAGEQAALRAAVAGIFVALARRLRSRTDPIAVSLDRLQRKETDPARMDHYFKIDHNAMMLRRLIANLMVLAGGHAGQPTAEPVRLVELLRAASQEIEDYTRVDIGRVDPEVQIDRDEAENLIHLLAELLDNATKFSPPGSMVLVEGVRVGDRLSLHVADRGIGMTAEVLDQVRKRLAHPLRLTHRTTQQMGMPVVGALAQRLGVTIEVRSEPQHGTRFDLAVPGRLFTMAPASTPALAASVESQARRPSADDATRVLPAHALSGPSGQHLTSGAPPTWPPTQREPATGAPKLPQAGAVSAVIYDQLGGDARRSWFDGAGSGRAGDLPPVPQDWQAAASAAEHARTARPTSRTRGGLPVRHPYQRVIPSLAGSDATVPVLRDPAEMRRQLGSLQRGLDAAGRSSHHVMEGTPS